MVAYILFGKIGAIYPAFILFIFLFFLISLIIKLVGFNFCDSLWNKNSKNRTAGMKIFQVFRRLMKRFGDHFGTILKAFSAQFGGPERTWQHIVYQKGEVFVVVGVLVYMYCAYVY